LSPSAHPALAVHAANGLVAAYPAGRGVGGLTAIEDDCDRMGAGESERPLPDSNRGMAGLESAAGPTEPTTLPSTSDKSFVRPDGALTKLAPDTDPDLARILAAWPALARPIKAAILALVVTSTTHEL